MGSDQRQRQGPVTEGRRALVICKGQQRQCVIVDLVRSIWSPSCVSRGSLGIARPAAS